MTIELVKLDAPVQMRPIEFRALQAQVTALLYGPMNRSIDTNEARNIMTACGISEMPVTIQEATQLKEWQPYAKAVREGGE